MAKDAVEPLLEVDDLTVQYPELAGILRGRPSVEGVGFAVRPGEAVGLVGVSGSGKSTVARALTGQLRPGRGRIHFGGRDLLECSTWAARRRRTAMRMVVGEDYAAQPPNRRVGTFVAEPLGAARLLASGGPHRERVEYALEMVGLSPAARYLDCYPHQLCRGERQRVAFARALVSGPRLLIADEPAGVLDAGLASELVELLSTVRAEHGIAVVYLTHDLELARRACDELVVLRGGRMVEQGPTERVLAHPRHPYTAELLSTVESKAA